MDIVAESDDERIILVEVEKQQRKTSVEQVADFQGKVALYESQHPEKVILAGFLSLGGFTEDALALCGVEGIGWSMELGGLDF